MKVYEDVENLCVAAGEEAEWSSHSGKQRGAGEVAQWAEVLEFYTRSPRVEGRN